MDIRRIEVLKDGDTVYGSRHRVRVVKNKVAPPLRVAEFDITNDDGISKAGGILDVATDLALLTKKGSFYYLGEKILGQGREGTKRAIEDDKALMTDLEKKIWETAAKAKKIPREVGEVPKEDEDGIEA